MSLETDTSKALDRAMVLLDTLSRSETALGTRELARLLHLPLATTHRLLTTMHAHDLVKQDPASEKYRLGFKVLELGARLLERLDVRQAALPIMRDIRDRCDETVSLFVLDGNSRVCVESVQSQQHVRRVVLIGVRYPLHAGATGKLLLACLPPKLQVPLLDTRLEPYTERTMIDRDQLLQELSEIRSRGYASTAGERTPDGASVAAPIWRHGDEGVVAALTISLPVTRFTSEAHDTLASLVVQGAAEISRQLGGTRPADCGPRSDVTDAWHRPSQPNRLSMDR